MIGKIARFPRPIQDQLNQRLETEEEARTILSWLNGLPEVQAVLQAHFDGMEVTAKNLSEHRNRGFLDWQQRQQALEFAANLKEDDAALQQILPSDLAEKLSRWISVRYAAATRALSATGADPEKELRHLRQITQFVLALRRGEFNAARLAIEQQRLTLELSETAEAREKEHWEWTQRPEIQAKLYPNTDPEKIRRNVVCMLDRELLGARAGAPPDETASPAALI